MTELTARCIEHLKEREWETPSAVAAAIGENRHAVDAALRRAAESGLLDRRDVPGDKRKVEYRVKIKKPSNPAGKPYARGYRWGI